MSRLGFVLPPFAVLCLLCCVCCGVLALVAGAYDAQSVAMQCSSFVAHVMASIAVWALVGVMLTVWPTFVAVLFLLM
jgi:hypothetical protein